MAASRNRFADLAWLILLSAVLGVLLMKLRPSPSAGETPIPIGTALPPVMVEGWLNVPEGEGFDPRGKLVVVDCWATWCGPCRADLPHMAKLVAEYRPLGVNFMGVTDESGPQVEQVKKVISDTPGFEWPVGYGGGAFLDKLGITGIPTVILFGPDGKCRWSGYGSTGLTDALDQALAASRK